MAESYRGRERIRGVAPSTKRAAMKLRKEMTPAEVILWKALRARRFSGYKFRRQHPVGRFILDFYCAECHLAVEVDGDSHLQQLAYDKYREEHLAMYGYRVLRFRNDEVLTDLTFVLTSIEQAVLDRKMRDAK